MEKKLRNGLILVAVWTTIRIIALGFIFFETTKLIDAFGGLISFLIYMVILDWLFKTTKPIDEALAGNLKKTKENIGNKIEEKFGNNGKEFWRGFNEPLP